MIADKTETQARTIAIMDLGSNSLRMIIVRIEKNRVTSILNQVKQMVRLGEGAFEARHLQPEPKKRTLEALRDFSGMCQSYGVDEIVALATAAVRDAADGQSFMDEIRKETGIDFTVISGKEEARLICLGVSVALEPFSGKRMFIDIGGGSTELSIAHGKSIEELESLKLGAVRLAGMFSCSGKVSVQSYAKMQQYVRNNAVLPLQRMDAQSPEELVGSSGTIQSLAEMAVAMERENGRKTGDTAEVLTYSGLRRVIKALCECNEEERTALPGMNPRRSAILITGAVILQTVMEEVGFEYVRVSSRGLRDGALVDYMERQFPERGSMSIREESALRLARLCRFEEVHSRHVAKLSSMLCDSARGAGLYSAPARMSELLHYAAILHDIGIFISFSKHNAHSYYLIQNSEMLGFTQKEVSFIAALAYFHRYGFIKKEKSGISIPDDWQEHARYLSLFLSLAEAMDKSHRQAVIFAGFLRKEGKVCLVVRTSGPCPVEQERMKRSLRALEKCFGQVSIVWDRME